MQSLALYSSFAALVALILLCGLAFKLLNQRRASAPRNVEELKPGVDSSSIRPMGRDYDVFLSFRGVDTRKRFTDHLYRGLLDVGICAFRDDEELHRGEEIGPNLLSIIENSQILIPIISLNYASSKWCLRELVYMMDCKKRLGRRVLPVFYKVKPADVEHLTGSFGEAFHNYHSQRNFDQKHVGEWKQALREVGSSQGLESEKVAYGYEGEMVKWIVRKVLNELKDKKNFGLVGIDKHVKKVMEFVNERPNATQYVGIYGVAGVGKTTLAGIVYNNLSNLFEHRSFIADIRELCKHNRIVNLQNQLIFDILRKHIHVHGKDEGITFISSRFKDKKVLILLDDVDDADELITLVGNYNWFAPGSRIIVTTRDRSVLDRMRVDIEYEHQEMDMNQALILFSRHAFGGDYPPNEFVTLSYRVVSIIGRLPLVLVVVGSLLYGKGEATWIDTIEKMQISPHSVIQDKLMMSYRVLDMEQKQIFLDIACFLVGNDARVASYMWNACGFYSRLEIEALRSLSFINIGDNHELMMHNQLRNLGREIVRNEDYDEPHNRSRLWDYEEALEVLEGKKGTKVIQAICLEKGNSTRVADGDNSDYIKDQERPTFTNKHFKNLTKLRFLHMSDVDLIGDFNEIFSQLRWLKWGNCSPTFAAENFHPKELVILDLSKSSISEDWQGWSSMMMAKKLKVLNLTGCHSLKSTFSLSAFQSLEILIFRDCRKLEQIDTCIGDVKTLISLDLRGCLCLKELPPQVGKLKLLEELILDQTMIQEIPSSIGFLKKLELLSAKDCKSLLELPDSICHLANLRCLSLRCCHQLRKIPNSIGKMELLTRLDLGGCLWLENLPPEMGQLEQLKELLLDQTMIRNISYPIGSLKKLEMLSAKDCKLLVELPWSIGSLVSLSTLVLSGCVELELLPNSIGLLVDLQCLSLGHCHRLRKIPKSIGNLKLLTRLDLRGCLCLEKLPALMGELEELKELLLDQTMIREIPSSFGSLKKLDTLSCKGCKSLLGLPDSIGRLVNLSTLVLSDCVELVALPDSIGALLNLEILNISHTKIKELPNSIGRLRKLRNLDASKCTKLRGEVPESIRNLSSLQHLDFHGCKELLSLSELPSSLTYLSVTCQIRCGSFLPTSFKLEILQILDCQFMELLDVSQLRHLRKLSVEFCNNILEVQGLDKLEYIESLTITDCDLIERLDHSKSGLKKLHARNCKNLVEIHGIDGLEFLEELNVSGCASIQRLDLPKSNGLKILDARNCDNLVEIQGLHRLEFLERLNISGCTSIQRLDLPKANGLKKLDAGNCNNLVEIQGLDRSKFLERLNICRCTSFERLPDLYCFDTLQKLAINNCDKLHDIRSLERFTSCTSLWIEDCTSLAKLPNLSNFRTLRKLFLSNCHELREIPGLEESKSLRHIAICGCSSIEILPDLSSCVELINLVVQNCEKLTKLRGLEKLEQLVELDISGCKSLEAIPELSRTRVYQNYEKKPFDSDHGMIEFGEDDSSESFGEDEDDLDESF